MSVFSRLFPEGGDASVPPVGPHPFASAATAAGASLPTPGRRVFLRQAAGLAALPSAGMALSLMGMGAAAAQSASSSPGFKALVCVFLAGGNDQSNTVVPVGPQSYSAYQAARPTLALPASSLLPLNLAGHRGEPLALHPSLAPIHPLFAQGRAALLANVGTLVVPMSQAQWNKGRPTVPVPQQLFSHSDQQGAWQTGLPDRASQTGWMGRMGDLLHAGFNAGSRLSMALSVAGNTVMLAGSRTVQYQLTTQGAVQVRALANLYGSTAGGQALRTLLTESRTHLLEAELNQIGRRALDTESLVNTALAQNPIATAFPSTGIGRQLQMAARMIAAHRALGQQRQLFVVQQGGYDFHDDLLADQATRLRELAEALAAFDQAMQALGLGQQVTAFTASDFGRALQHNGRGSDHGWGSHHFVLGGAVAGNRVHGTFPTVALNGPEDAGQGRLIPTTAVDQYVASLARWFGVAEGDLPTVLPNIGRFDARALDLFGPVA